MTTIGYFPEILPDELLYSVVARLARHRGVEVDAVLARELFGRRHAVAAADLPGGLAALAERLDPARGLDVGNLIDQTTLFPFYAAYAPAQVRAAVRSLMATSTSGAHTMLGVTTFRIPPLRALRYCPDCIPVMDRKSGERYWRRSHQLSGTHVCPDHGVPLVESGVLLGGRHRHRFVAAADAIPMIVVSNARSLPDAVSLRLRELAAAAAHLLVSPTPAVDPVEQAEGYRDRLAEVGLMRSVAKVDQEALEAAFRLHWGGTLEQVPGIMVDGELAGGWLSAMVRRRPRAAHPVCHLLLQLFLAAQAVKAGPFGRGPWPCRNPLVPHHGRHTVTDLVIRRDRDVRYGDFLCACGYVYTRRVDADGVLGSPRYRSFGPTFAPALRNAVAGTGGLRATAKAFGLDPKTLMREAALAGVAVPWRLRPSGRTCVKERTSRPSRVSADRRSNAKHGGKARDWTLVDRRLAKATTDQVAAVRSETPPVRVTFAELERRVARYGWIMKRKAKLPRTAEMIAAVLESSEAFRLRRLDWALASTAGDPVRTPSDILRLAGLPVSWMAVVGRALRNPPVIGDEAKAA